MSLFSVLAKHQASITKRILEGIEEKCMTIFKEVLPIFSELKSIYESTHPVQTGRLVLLHEIPKMPEVSTIKRVELAMSCCNGSTPFQEDGVSHYRSKKFRNASLIFLGCNRFQYDPFDGNGIWLQDLEDCNNLFEARAMIHLLVSAIRKRHFRLNRMTPNDWLITISEFSRKLLFDEESGREAIEILHHTILAMKTNGIENYTQLFHPQEINLIAGC